MTKLISIVSFVSLLSTMEQPFPAEKRESAPLQNETQQNSLSLFHHAILKSFSMKGDFSQQVQCGDETAAAGFHGTFEVKRKGKYRFSFTHPNGILMVSDGDAAHVYSKQTALVLPGSDASALLTSLAKLLLGETIEDFDIETMKPTNTISTEFTVLSLTPRIPDPFIRRVLLTLSVKPPFLKRVIIVDAGGCIIQTTLNNVQVDTGIKDRRFQFVPPKNATVVSP